MPGLHTDPSTTRRGSRILGVFVGILVVWQLMFMLMSTLDSVLIGSQSPWEEVETISVEASSAEALFLPSRQWARLTLQTQTWGLFSKVVPRSTFPVVTLFWTNPDGTEQRGVTLRSDFQPGPGEIPYLENLVLVRPFHYEGFFTATHIHWDDATVDQQTSKYQSSRIAKVRARWQPSFEFMTHRMNEFLATHPQSTPPTEVILSFDVIPTNPPSEAPANPLQPVNRPFIRWRPGESATPGMLPVEAYDPQAREFKPVPRLP